MEAAFGEFRRTGELPDDVGLAYAVTRRAKVGFASVYRPDGSMDWGATMQVALSSPSRKPDPILDELYLEAIFGPELVRWAARQVLRSLAAVGEDVSQPQFLHWKPDLPKFGAVGLSILGFPQRLAKAPHAKRAHELFARMESLADQIGHRSRHWHKSVTRAIEAFDESGELPDDAQMRECVLNSAEMVALVDHFCGADVAADLDHLDQLRAEAMP
ncbi:MAG: hypothetical protein H6835_05310 [Planctomycetes bacterium]|nr:hypothetical protein [Planctomycetota bacterium]